MTAGNSAAVQPEWLLLAEKLKRMKTMMPRRPARFAARCHEGGCGTRPVRPPFCCVLPFCWAAGDEPLRRSSRFFGSAVASSGGVSSSWPSESTYTNSYSCRFSFASRRRCFLVGIGLA